MSTASATRALTSTVPTNEENKSNRQATPIVATWATIISKSEIDIRWASSQCPLFSKVTKVIICDTFTFLPIRDYFRFLTSCKSARALCSDASVWSRLATRFELHPPKTPLVVWMRGTRLELEPGTLPSLYHQLKVERKLAKETVRCFKKRAVLAEQVFVFEKTSYKSLLKVVEQHRDSLVGDLHKFAAFSVECVKIILTSTNMTKELRCQAIGMAAASTCPVEILDTLQENFSIL